MSSSDFDKDIQNILTQPDGKERLMIKCERMLTNKDKWTIALMASLLFLIVSSSFLYRFVDGVFAGFGWQIANSAGCPTFFGSILFTIIFAIIVRLVLR